MALCALITTVMTKTDLSNKLKHFFHVVSNIRPVIWIGSYVALMPIFAVFYWLMPDGQFRIPDGGTTDFGSWLYYSIVTITTLGFGDYTPMHGLSQIVTAVEVMCGLVILGFFLNAVGSMKSEIDVESEIEKQKRVHFSLEKQKLLTTIPSVLHNINTFLAYCYAVTTPLSDRNKADTEYNPDFKFSDMADMFKPSGLPSDNTRLPAVARLVKSAANTSLCLDSLQNRVDLTLWPDLLEDSFAFVAGFQMFSSTDTLSRHPKELVESHNGDDKDAEARISSDIASFASASAAKSESRMQPVVELYDFIRNNAAIARKIETALTALSSQS